MLKEMFERTLNNDPYKSDAWIRQQAYREWVDVLCQLWEAIGKPVNDKQLAVYVKQLGGVPMAILEDVVSALLREHTWNNVPTLGEIWACIRERHGEPENWIVKERPWVWRLMGDGVMPEVLE